MGIDTSKICYGCFGEHDGNGACPHCGFDINTAKHPAIALPIGTILNGRYLTGRVLGVGGFGVTYLAMDMTLETPVAVKEYLPSGIAIRDNDHYTMTVSSQDEQTKFDNGATKFLDEARILAKLRTVPNIVTVHDYFRENGTAYFVMEYIEGVDLMKYTTAKGGKLSFEETRDLLLPIIKSLGSVHEHNLLHRDISPDNIIVTKNGTTHLLDFGAARLAIDSEKSKSIILKHGFAPEEQYRKHGNQGPWSDEYALAATMYLVMTGIMPPDAIERVHEDTLKSPAELGIEIPGYANDALMKALSVQASGRFPDMKSFADAFTGKSSSSGAAVSPSAAVSSSAAVFGASQSPDDYLSVPTVAMDEPAAATTSAAAATTGAFGAGAPEAPEAPSPFKPAASEPSEPSPFKPAAASSFAPASPVLAPAASAGRMGGSTPSPVPVTTQEKKSIWKKPLTWIIVGVIAAGAIATPITYFALKGKSDEEIVETTKKKTKKTTADTTTEEPSTTTEEPTTTTTEEPTTTTTAAPVQPANTTPYTIQDIGYSVTSDWSFVEQNGYHYFFPERGNADNFMMAYSVQSLTPDQAKIASFDSFMDGFVSEIMKGEDFKNAQILSQTINKDTDLNYSDILMTCDYLTAPKEIAMHIVLDKTTGYSYIFMMYINAGLPDAERDAFMNPYNAAIASIEKTGAANPTPAQTTPTTKGTSQNLGDVTEYSLGDIKYRVCTAWEHLSQGGYEYFFHSLTDAENFMMVYQMTATTKDLAKSYDVKGFMEAFNQSMQTSAEFPNAKILSTSVNTDSDLAYGDTSMTCDYQGKPKELDFRVVFDRNSGKAYIFMMYMDQNLDQTVRQDYLDKFNAALDSIEYK